MSYNFLPTSFGFLTLSSYSLHNFLATVVISAVANNLVISSSRYLSHYISSSTYSCPFNFIAKYDHPLKLVLCDTLTLQSDCIPTLRLDYKVDCKIFVMHGLT
jgi:hypothetical protein